MAEKKRSVYDIVSFVLITIVAILFTFPLYWIITGSFKTKMDIIRYSGVVAFRVGDG